jgi:peptidoglycan/LPS O-acetylase OafA/YrhL
MSKGGVTAAPAQGYRTDVEGLRAFAVVPILLFHLSESWCPGGFVGVDIFFVISGYLITRLILVDGTAFSFGAFYSRRFLRLFPALFATLLLTLAAGWRILGPAEYEELARSAIAASFGISNFHFLAAIDYFNANVFSHHLLHTWSLGVEEQFYALWPLLLCFTRFQSRNVIKLALALSVLSLISVLVVRSVSPDVTFYMMPFRMFEFGVGALLTCSERSLVRLPKHAGGAIGASGAALIFSSLFLIDKQTTWPGLWTLAPVIGTALLIVAGQNGFWQRALSLTPFRFLGKISYSLYLVHWPIITLYRSYTITAPGVYELIALGAASIAAGAALSFGVEQRFRLHTAATNGNLLPHARFLAVGLSGLAVLSASITIAVQQGFPSRVDRHRVQALDKGLTFAGDLCSSKRSKCLFGDKSSQRIVYVMGDSLALNLIHGLDQFFLDQKIKGIALYDYGCLFAFRTKRFIAGNPDEDCRKNIADAYDLLSNDRQPVIIAGDYAGYRNDIGPATASTPLRQTEDEYYSWLRQQFRESLLKLDIGHRPIILLKQSYSTGIDLPKCLSRPAPTAVGTSESSRCMPLTLLQVQSLFKNADNLIDLVANDFSALTVIDPKLQFCDVQQCTTSANGELFFRDAAHLTNAGSKYFVQRIREDLIKGLSK